MANRYVVVQGKVHPQALKNAGEPCWFIYDLKRDQQGLASYMSKDAAEKVAYEKNEKDGGLFQHFDRGKLKKISPKK